MSVVTTGEQVVSDLDLWRQMLLIRIVEERCERLYRDAKIKGSLHLYIGQEAVAVGACSALRPDDPISFTYRSHGWALARGISPLAVFAECMGREAGCARGRGGSKHLGDWSRRILPSNSIVGANLPLMVGTALAATRLGRPEVSLAAFGDGATNQAVVHEALTQAVIWNLPVVFVCENNRYAEMSPAGSFTPVPEIVDRALGHGITGAVCDGMDVEDVRRVVGEAVDRARAGGGPTFIEARTYRFCGHMTGDQQDYRTKDEVEQWRQRDPLTVLAGRLAERGRVASELEAIRADITAAVEEAEALASESPLPDPGSILDGAPSWTGEIA